MGSGGNNQKIGITGKSWKSPNYDDQVVTGNLVLTNPKENKIEKNSCIDARKGAFLLFGWLV